MHPPNSIGSGWAVPVGQLIIFKIIQPGSPETGSKAVLAFCLPLYVTPGQNVMLSIDLEQCSCSQILLQMFYLYLIVHEQREERTSPPHTGHTEQPVSEQYSVSPNCMTPVPLQYLHSTVPLLTQALQRLGLPSCITIAEWATRSETSRSRTYYLDDYERQIGSDAAQTSECTFGAPSRTCHVISSMRRLL